MASSKHKAYMHSNPCKSGSNVRVHTILTEYFPKYLVIKFIVFFPDNVRMGS